MGAGVPTFVQRMASWPRQWRMSVQRRGMGATARLAAARAFKILTLRQARETWAERAFDETYGIETAGSVSLAALECNGGNWKHGYLYMGANPRYVRAMLAGLPGDVSDMTFVDFGSGKGRVILLASEWRFGRIVGVELSPTLHACAQRNIAAFHSGRQACRRIESVCMDAAAYELPTEPAVLFFYNPFERPVAEAVMRHVRTSLVARPRKMLAMLLSCAWGDAVVAAGFRQIAWDVGVPGAELFEAVGP